MPTKAADTFERVRSVGLALPDVEATTKYDGSPVLKVRGCFMAGLATHPSAEPQTLVVRIDLEEREWLLQDAPETYYVTDYYEKYPLVLVRLSRIDRDALRDLLSVSWRLGAAKAGHYPRKPGRRGNKTHRDLSAETRKRGKQTRSGSIRGVDEGAELWRDASR
jgi:hypothetical protein